MREQTPRSSWLFSGPTAAHRRCCCRRMRTGGQTLMFSIFIHATNCEMKRVSINTSGSKLRAFCGERKVWARSRGHVQYGDRRRRTTEKNATSNWWIGQSTRLVSWQGQLTLYTDTVNEYVDTVKMLNNYSKRKNVQILLFSISDHPQKFSVLVKCLFVIKKKLQISSIKHKSSSIKSRRVIAISFQDQ